MTPLSEEDRKTWVRGMGLFMAILSDLAASIGLGVGAGYWAWKKAGAPSWILAVTTLAGVGAGTYLVYREMKSNDKAL